MAEFEIKVTELESSGKQHDFVLSSAWLDHALAEVAVEGTAKLQADPEKPEGTVSVYAEKSGEDVVVRGEVRANLMTECARCLGDARFSVATPLAVLFTRGQSLTRGQGRLESAKVAMIDAEELSDEPDTEVFTGDTIALDTLVREHVLLEVPMQSLCSETCKGLEVPPEVRGPADLSDDMPKHEGKRVDPRLAPLLELMEKTKKGSS
jgi:uncharacterized protein